MPLLRSALLLGLPLVGACSFTADFDRFRFGDAGSGDAGSDAGGDAQVDGGNIPLPCVAATLVEGMAVDATTLDGTDTYTASCGGGGSPDIAYEFVAPAATYYRITTAGSAIDTVLSVRDPACDASATERFCNNNAGASPTSEIVLPLAKNQKILIVVDGNAAQGAVRVLAERIACPATSIQASTPIEHTTVGRPDDHSGPCGGAGQGDQAYRFVPPADGFYAMRATKVASNTRTSISVEEGPVCGGPLLQCNRGDDGRSEVVRYLHAGAPVTIWVDAVDTASSGSYSLVVEPAAGTSMCVNSGALPSDLTPVNTTLADTDAHHFSTSCAPTSVWWNGRTNPADIHPFPDRTFGIDLPMVGPGCSFNCSISITARFPFVAAILDGTECSGAELSCYGNPTMSTPVPNEPIWQQTIDLEGVPIGSPTGRTLLIDRLIEDYQGGPVISLPYGDTLTITMGCGGIC